MSKLQLIYLYVNWTRLVCLLQIVIYEEKSMGTIAEPDASSAVLAYSFVVLGIVLLFIMFMIFLLGKASCWHEPAIHLPAPAPVEMPEKLAAQAVRADLDILVVMAGDEKPTYIAKPVAPPAPQQFCDEVPHSKLYN